MEKKEQNSNVKWKTTSSDVKCVKKQDKVMFFIQLENGEIVAFSYHKNFLEKVLNLSEKEAV